MSRLNRLIEGKKHNSIVELNNHEICCVEGARSFAESLKDRQTLARLVGLIATLATTVVFLLDDHISKSNYRNQHLLNARVALKMIAGFFEGACVVSIAMVQKDKT